MVMFSMFFFCGPLKANPSKGESLSTPAKEHLKTTKGKPMGLLGLERTCSQLRPASVPLARLGVSFRNSMAGWCKLWCLLSFFQACLGRTTSQTTYHNPGSVGTIRCPKPVPKQHVVVF